MAVNRGKWIAKMGDAYLGRIQDQIRRNSHSDNANNCWLWRLSLQRNGYAQTRAWGKMMPAHRAAYLAFRGDIDDGKEVCHSCDVRRCVNPDHLYLATHAENMTDMRLKGRGMNGIMSGKYKPERNDLGQFMKLYRR